MENKTTKFCNGCKQEKDLSEFTDRKYKKSGNVGKYFVCKSCKQINNRKWALSTKGGWVSTMLTKAKTRSKEKNIEFNITKEDINIPEYCPVLGIKIEKNPDAITKNSPNLPTLDRVDNNKGYIKGNIKVISYRANALKNNATLEELEMVINYMRET